VHKDITTTEEATVNIKLAQGSFSNNAELIRVEAPSPYSQV
jgi:hypothetical protein